MTLRACLRFLAVALTFALPVATLGGETRLTSALNELELDLQMRFAALPPPNQGTRDQERLRTLLPGMIRELGLGSRTAAEELVHVKRTVKILPKLLPADPDIPPLLGRTLDGFQDFLTEEAADIADWLAGIGELADGQSFRLLNEARGQLDDAATLTPFTARQKALFNVDTKLQAVDNAAGIVKFSAKGCPIKSKPGPGEFARAALISRDAVGPVSLIFFAHTLARSAQRDAQGDITRLEMEFHYCTRKQFADLEFSLPLLGPGVYEIKPYEEGGIVTGNCHDGVAGGGSGFGLNFRGTMTVLAFDPKGGLFHAKFSGNSTCRYANGEILLTGF